MTIAQGTNPLAKRLPWKARQVLFDLLDFVPFPAQSLPLSDTESFTIVFAGGVGSSKTEIAEKYLLCECLPDYMRAVYLAEAGIDVQYTGKEVRKYFWVVAPDYQLPREVFQRLADDLVKLGIKMDGPNQPMEGEWQLRLRDTGTEISTKSANQPNSFHSKALSGIVVDEAALISDWVRRERLVPRLTRGGVSDPWLFCSGTFEGMGWMANLFELGQGPNDQGVASYNMSTWQNPVSFPSITADTDAWLTWYCQNLPDGKELATQGDALERLKRESRDLYHALTTMPTESFAQRYGAKPQKPTGLVFKDFDYRKHVSKDLAFDPDREVEVWIDPGAMGPYAVLAVQFAGETVQVIDEVYFRQTTSEEIIKECITRPWWGRVRQGQIDATQVEQKAVWQRSELWAARGLTPPFLRSQKVLIDVGIERLRLWLRQPGTEESRILIADRCVNLIKEFGLYRWEEMRGEMGEYKPVPKKANDHCLNALWYGIVSKWGIGASEKVGARTLTHRPRFPVR